MTFFVDPTNYGDRIFLGMSGTRALVFLTDDAPEGTFYFMVTAQKDGFSTEFEIALEVVRTAANNLLASPASLEEEPIEEAPPRRRSRSRTVGSPRRARLPTARPLTQETPAPESPMGNRSPARNRAPTSSSLRRSRTPGRISPGLNPGGDGMGSESKPEVAPASGQVRGNSR